MTMKRLIIIIFVSCLALSTSGCWDAMDVNAKALVTLVITDRQDDEFMFFVEVPNLSTGSSQDGSKEQYQIVTGSGKTYAEARRRLNAKMDKPIFLGTVGSLILTNSLAKFGIEEYMLRLQSMIDYRKVLNIITTNESPEDLLSALPENNVAYGYSIEDTIESLENSGVAVVYSASDVLEFIFADYSYALINVDLRDNQIAYTGYSIMHNNKFLEFIPFEESFGLVWLLGDKIKRVYVVPFNDDCYATVEVKLKKRKVKPDFTGGHITFKIDFTMNAHVMYLNKNLEFDDAAQLEVETTLENMIVQDIANSINKSKLLQCDYLGFNEHFRLKYPNDVKSIKWLKAYLSSNMNISVDCALDPGGIRDFEAQGKEIED